MAPRPSPVAPLKSVPALKTYLGINDNDGAWDDFDGVARRVYQENDFNMLLSWTQLPTTIKTNAVHLCIRNLREANTYSSFKRENLFNAFHARLSVLHVQTTFNTKHGIKPRNGARAARFMAEYPKRRAAMRNEARAPLKGKRLPPSPSPRSPVTNRSVSPRPTSEEPRVFPNIDAEEAELDKLISEQKEKQRQLHVRKNRIGLVKKTSILRKLEEETRLLEREVQAEEAAAL